MISSKANYYDGIAINPITYSNRFAKQIVFRPIHLAPRKIGLVIVARGDCVDNWLDCRTEINVCATRVSEQNKERKNGISPKMRIMLKNNLSTQ